MGEHEISPGAFMEVGPKHELLGSVCLCGEWFAQCGNDISGQWAAHVNSESGRG